MLNRNSLPVQFRVGVKLYPLFFFILLLPGVIFFSIQNCLMMQSLSRETQRAYLNRPAGHSSAKKNNKKTDSVHQPDSKDGWNHKCRFACSGHTDEACLCVYFCSANSLLLSPVSQKTLHSWRHPRVKPACPSLSVVLKATESPLLSKCHWRIKTD